MKRNDFAHPQRQSYVAILLIVFKTYRIIFQQMLPVFLLILLGKGDTRGAFIWYGAIGLAIVSMIFAIISYYRFVFYVRGDELIIEKGVFKRQKLSIDTDRIQTVNFEQNIVHKIFKVTKLKADTAGSQKEEFELDAVSIDVGEGLQSIILQSKSNIEFSQESSDSDTQVEKESKIMSISPAELFRAGMVENHLRSSGLIAAFLSYIYFNLQEVGIHAEDYLEDYDFVGIGLIGGLIIVLAVFIISFIISMVRMVLRYFDLKVVRSDNGFKYSAGLFTTRTVSAKDKKIQTLSWSDNKLKKLLGIFDVRIRQAGSQQVDAKQLIKIPACKIDHVNQMVGFLYPDLNIDPASERQIDRRWLKRQWMYRSIFGILLTALLGLTHTYLIAIGLIILFFLIYNAWLQFKKARYSFDENYLMIKGGIYGDSNTILPIHKIQSIRQRTTPYMRRNGLVTLVFSHAAGTDAIPYITEKEAQRLSDYFLYRVEAFDQAWM